MLVLGMLLLVLLMLCFEFAVVGERIRGQDGKTSGLPYCHELMAAAAGEETLRWVLRYCGPRQHKTEVCCDWRAELRHVEQQRCKLARVCFGVDGSLT
jgi:hypothetical protein